MSFENDIFVASAFKAIMLKDVLFCKRDTVEK